MKSQILIPACLLLLWTLAGAKGEDAGIPVVKPAPGGIKLTCSGAYKIKHPDEANGDLNLAYRDDNTGEYTCVSNIDPSDEKSKIFVKFRTCDNCIELDTGAIVGMTVGNIVATIVVGVAVYLVASQSRTGTVTSNKKSSDRQHLVPREARERAPNDHYQPLKHKGGQKDMYDVLNSRR